MSASTFGPGTVTFGTAPGQSFECEVTGGKVTHAYEEVEQRTRLCDTAARNPRKVRASDGLSLDLVNDLTAAGLYAYIHANDLADVPVEFVPNTADGAKWAGTVTLLLPAEIGAGEWGEELASTVELPAVGTLTFTPATAPAAAGKSTPDLAKITA